MKKLSTALFVSTCSTEANLAKGVPSLLLELSIAAKGKSMSVIVGSRDVQDGIAYVWEDPSMRRKAHVLRVPKDEAAQMLRRFIRRLSGSVVAVVDVAECDWIQFESFMTNYWPRNLSRTPYGLSAPSGSKRVRSAVDEATSIWFRRGRPEDARSKVRVMNYVWTAARHAGWKPGISLRT